MKGKIFLFILILSLFLNADEKKLRGFVDIKKVENIIGDIYLDSSHKKFDLEKNPFKEYFLRNFNLEYNFSITKSPINGDSELVIGEEKHREYIENFKKNKDPYK